MAGILTVSHAFYSKEFFVGLLILGTNLIFNLFPVFHQRYKRVRSRRYARKDPQQMADKL